MRDPAPRKAPLDIRALWVNSTEVRTPSSAIPSNSASPVVPLAHHGSLRMGQRFAGTTGEDARAHVDRQGAISPLRMAVFQFSQ